MKPDSIIFDMDGTLWDNVNSYEIVWNFGLEKMGFERRINRNELIGMMGKEARAILNAVIPHESEATQDELYEIVLSDYQKLLPQIKPLIYPGVLDGLEKLSAKYPIFLLSNCEKDGLVNFMNHTKISHLITDYMEHGLNLKPKSYNLKLLVDKHKLQAPFYVGDTASDSHEAGKAGVPFVFVSYGFGEAKEYHLKFNSFYELSDYFLKLND